MEPKQGRLWISELQRTISCSEVRSAKRLKAVSFSLRGRSRCWAPTRNGSLQAGCTGWLSLLNNPMIEILLSPFYSQINWGLENKLPIWTGFPKQGPVRKCRVWTLYSSGLSLTGVTVWFSIQTPGHSCKGRGHQSLIVFLGWQV